VELNLSITILNI